MEINEAIPYKEFLLIDANGEKLGILKKEDAIKKAENENLDVVLVSTGNLPVCKILDYNKMKFEQKKKEKEIKKNQKITENSEVQITLVTQFHDMQTKATTAKRLIQEKGNNVVVVLKLRGREMNQSEAGLDKIKQFADFCKSFAKIKKEPSLDGRDIRMILEKL